VNAYGVGGHVPRVRLNIYLNRTPCGAPLGDPPGAPYNVFPRFRFDGRPRDCATKLRNFAENSNFELNIKVSMYSYCGNADDLSYLMTSKYCTVEAFTEEDDRNLTRYLGFPAPENWELAQDMIIYRNLWTLHLLHECWCSKYDYINCYSMQISKLLI